MSGTVLFMHPGVFERLMLVACGGAIGSLARYCAATQFGATWRTTLCVNASGSFLVGLLFTLTSAHDVRLRLALATGFLGGYTTFSAWQLESLVEARGGTWARGLAILTSSAIIGFAAVAAGAWVGEQMTGKTHPFEQSSPREASCRVDPPVG